VVTSRHGPGQGGLLARVDTLERYVRDLQEFVERMASDMLDRLGGRKNEVDTIRQELPDLLGELPSDAGDLMHAALDRLAG
jgi:hypothetical protein